jgi:proteasome beta subunit
MTEDEAKNLAIKAIKSSIQRDSASGDGIDLLLISASGILQNSMNAS